MVEPDRQTVRSNTDKAGRGSAESLPIPEKSIAVLPVRKLEQRQTKRLLCRRHPGRDSDALIEDRRSKGDFAHLDADVTKARRKTWEIARQLGVAHVLGRKRAEERRRRARQCAADQGSQ